MGLLDRMLSEEEFLSPFGIRSLSKAHLNHPVTVELGGRRYTVSYEPGESQTGMFGGNSNWRGPIWFPTNYLLVDALKRYHHFFGDALEVEFPVGSGVSMNLEQAAHQIESRLVSLFCREGGHIPSMPELSQREPAELWTQELLSHEYFNAETGEGLGACHQTGWTALVANLHKSGL